MTVVTFVLYFSVGLLFSRTILIVTAKRPPVAGAGHGEQGGTLIQGFLKLLQDPGARELFPPPHCHQLCPPNVSRGSVDL